MDEHADVVILGGGVIGLTTAYFLAREGTRVTVLDRGDFGQESSWAGAGILPPAGSEAAPTPYQQLRDRSARMFPKLSEELREFTAVDNGYVRSGGLQFLHDLGRPEEWHSGSDGLQSLDESALLRLEPGIGAELGRAILLREMAQLRNPRHLRALLAACSSCGVRLLSGWPADDFVRTGKRVTAVRSTAGTIRADRYLIAAGAWSDRLVASVGCNLGVYPVRGQIVLLRLPAPAFRRILLWGNQYLVPRPDGLVLVGSTEENVGYDKRNTAAAIEQLLAMAARLVPALKSAHLERCWAGLRPGSPDGLPFLGAVPGFENLFVAAGHFRSGIFLSPATALVMKELLLGQPLSVCLDGFRLDRTVSVAR